MESKMTEGNIIIHRHLGTLIRLDKYVEPKHNPAALFPGDWKITVRFKDRDKWLISEVYGNGYAMNENYVEATIIESLPLKNRGI
jgi:hypothetical protein